jgi:response regulator RpfG family c-di-GMP phosphodiesterase
MADNSNRVLIVDDDQRLLHALRRDLSRFFDVDVALDGEEALALMESDGPYQVLLVDMSMPIMNGIEFLKEAKKLTPESVSLMLTGDCEQSTAVKAINEGKVFQFLNKPCPVKEIKDAIDNAIDEYNVALMSGTQPTQVLSGAVKMVRDLASGVQSRSSREMEQLLDAIQEICAVIPAANYDEVCEAAALVDLYLSYLPGKLRSAVRKRVPTSHAEKEVIAKALARSHDTLIQIPPLAAVARIVYYHQKNFDGSGVPFDSVSEEEIPLGARVMRIAVDYAALRNQRLPVKYAVARMYRRWGVYDPQILDAMANAGYEQ